MYSPSQQLIHLGLGFMVSQALRVATDLNVADRLVAGERSVDDLAEETHCHCDALYRIMRLLAAEGVFSETSARRFQLTELGAALLSDAPSSPRDLIRMMNREPYLAFAQLTHSVQTGLPTFETVFGKPRFDWLADHPDAASLFQQAMIALSQGANEAVAEACDFGAFSQIVDVGGGHGQLLSEILKRHPHLSGILFDLPAGVEAARANAASFPPQTSFVAGNFFNAVPAGADVYIMKKVIHDWNDEQAVRILRNCREVMKPHGRVLIAETIIPPGNERNTIKLIDANMLVVTGGVERTESEFAALLAAAGLRLERVISTARAISVLEASRA
ncbi:MULTISPECIES: methyltransferase [unclassified Bradyrhizobium]|uniref:methyltransferase n=1 Tax=unclassified Bradyrhizobium TaxID=2631580 RepID=UPI0023021E3C|nr:methyltransferase [Bradyrhizobium sp. CCBAU 45321]MDA9544365.1 ubiquinone/menaquinone biosynthesis protein [Bradyrhizobium sp. CCBAU 45321]